LLYANELIDEKYASKQIVGLKETPRKTVKLYYSQPVEEITDIPQEQIQEAAKIIGTTKSLLSTAL